ncbi:MAG TPA: DUF2071 domain-containing protein, partial [Chryseolinea sp.]|nr:DUF2071 domain-containing protein [Chryseolinea sp.]
KLPVLDGIIDRRILINYRVHPEVIKNLLPPHLDPLVINGYGSAGICLLRLKNIGIKHSSQFLRITSENAAHRFLVKWIENGEEMHGVYIPRRDTDSVLNVWLAGNLFSWPHYMAHFEIQEGRGSYSLKMKSKDMSSHLQIRAEIANDFPTVSMFDSLEHASTCFQNCAVGISPSKNPNQLKVIQLKTKTWIVTPLHVQELQSSYFENSNLFPTGQIHFDNALLMEGIEHEWHGYSSK